MIQLPDRLASLVAKIEAGEAVTSDDIDRIASLQALDLARAGRMFVQQACAAEEKQTEELRKALEAA